MASLKSLNPFLKSNNDTGFGANASGYGGRFINKDGTFNIQKTGIPLSERFSIYHSMLNMPRWKFALVIVSFFFGINLVYTLVYLAIGKHEFTGMIATGWWQEFLELYFFSTETFTTVGYGRVNPVGTAANFVAAFEAMSGFLSFAVTTGLIYGRFSRPKAFISFSDNAVITSFKDKTALMFRIASYKDLHVLTNAEIRVTTGMLQAENEHRNYKFYELELERNRVDSLMMNWTVVHVIDENSPLFDLSPEDMKEADVEVYVLVRGFDDVYSNTVLKRTSYTYDEILFDKKFVPMYKESEDGKTTIVELHKLNEFQ
ncbi:ion channel [Foetidibacter luteolus]|uniref:ion channel n=1 Tax=Foetidibacter luteolus TaxID=2608880 RepID=UPI00129B468C|nr:ion channel [Foetidibacter luteolus]